MLVLRSTACLVMPGAPFYLMVTLRSMLLLLFRLLTALPWTQVHTIMPAHLWRLLYHREVTRASSR